MARKDHRTHGKGNRNLLGPPGHRAELIWFFDLENSSLSANLKNADVRPTAHPHFLDQISQFQTQNLM